MRIEELYLDGFGRFHQRRIGPLVGAMTVFYGPNEAGKSTLLAFIRAILFGFPPRYNSHYPPRAGGRHGGRITLSASAGMKYVVERYAGARGGLNLATPHGPGANPEAILQRLTGNASPDLFRNVFAFSLDELQAAASLNDSSGTIYSAGQGAPGLPALRKSLSDRKDQIYLSRGRATDREVPRLVSALRDIEAHLKVIEVSAERYGELTGRRSEIDMELRDADAELARLQAERNEIDRRLDGWDDWVALSGCETQLQDMPKYVDFPDDPILRLESLEERVRRTREDRDEAAGQLRLAREAAAAEIPGEELLYDRERVETIRRARSSFDNSVRDLPERQAELRGMEADFARNLADLGHSWGETELQAFDTSLPVRDRVDRRRLQINKSDERARQAQIQLAQERRTLQDRQLETQEARDKLPPEPPPLDEDALMEGRVKLQATRGRLTKYENHRKNLENLQGQEDALEASRETPEGATGRRNLPLLIALALAGGLLFAAGVLLGGDSLLFGMVSGLVLLAAAAVLWYAGKPVPVPAPSPMASAIGRQIADVDVATETARQALLESAAALNLEGQPDAAALDSVEAQLVAARGALDSWNAARARVEEATRRAGLQEKRVESAVQDHEAAEASAKEARQKWRQWLGERKLDQTLTSEAVTTFLARVETTRSSLSEARRMRDRWLPSSTTSGSFASRWNPLPGATACFWIPMTGADWRPWPTNSSASLKKLKRLSPTGSKPGNKRRNTGSYWKTGSGVRSRRRRSLPHCWLPAAATTPRSFAGGRASTGNGWNWSGSGLYTAAAWSASADQATGSGPFASRWQTRIPIGWTRNPLGCRSVKGRLKPIATRCGKNAAALTPSWRVCPAKKNRPPCASAAAPCRSNCGNIPASGRGSPSPRSCWQRRREGSRRNASPASSGMPRLFSPESQARATCACTSPSASRP